MFDSSVARGEPATFPLNGVVKGWTEGVQLMVRRRKDALLDPAGSRVRRQAAAAGAPSGELVFDIELLNIQ